MKRTLVFLITCLFVLSACSPKPTGSEVKSELPQDVTAQNSEDSASAPTAEAEPTVEPVPTEESEVEQTEEAVGNIEEFEIFNPYQAFSEEEMISLGAADFTGTDQEIAQMIINWQNGNMHYIGDPNQQADISHPMRWNYFMPGIYPVSDMVQERLMADGKIYGLCWDYASIFTAMASYYGLDVRVTAYKALLSDLNPQFQKGAGMSMEEYEAILPRLTEQGLNIDYDHISQSSRETWSHYRAEVKIGEEWVAFDGAPGVSEEYAAKTYSVAAWNEGYDTNLLYGENLFHKQVLDFAVISELLASAPIDGYEGITDDAGNPNRAIAMMDLISGKGLVPYFEEQEDIMAFLSIADGGEFTDEDLVELMEIKTEYEDETGKLFFAIADCMIYVEDDVEAADYILYYNAFTGSNMTVAEFEMYVQ